MGTRTRSRKRALELLFQADLREQQLSAVIESEAQRAAGEPEHMRTWLYARELVDGVADHGPDVDAAITRFSEDWTLQRMPNVDRAILRMATWEILFNPEVPDEVAIDEAVELAKE